MATPDDIFQGLVSRGLPAHVAQGIVMNFQDESGLNPGINEAAPIVPGSRGGFGLAQWTGPRRKALESYAASSGRPVDDVDTQLDFLMTELEGPEKAAFQKTLAAGDAGQAAAAFATNFLRPAKQHLDRRVANYTSGETFPLNGVPAEPIDNALRTASAPDLSRLQAMLDEQQGPQNPQLWGGLDPSAYISRRRFG